MHTQQKHEIKIWNPLKNKGNISQWPAVCVCVRVYHICSSNMSKHKNKINNVEYTASHLGEPLRPLAQIFPSIATIFFLT